MADGSPGRSENGSESLLLAIDGLLGNLTEGGHLSYGEVIKFLEGRRRDKESPLVPLSVFRNRELGSLEALTKFLREHHGLGHSEIAGLLNRDSRTIWTTYDSAKRKCSAPHVPSERDVWVPSTLFCDRRLGPLEALSLHLHEKGHSYTEIASFLNRDSRTIWTTCKRAREKLASGKAGGDAR